MPIFNSNNKIDKINVGNINIQSVYTGNNKVFPASSLPYPWNGMTYDGNVAIFKSLGVYSNFEYLPFDCANRILNFKFVSSDKPVTNYSDVSQVNWTQTSVGTHFIWTVNGIHQNRGFSILEQNIDSYGRNMVIFSIFYNVNKKDSSFSVPTIFNNYKGYAELWIS